MIVDGQRPPRLAPMEPITLRNLGPAPQLTGVETLEIDMAFWLSESEWPTTERMDLSELAG